MHIQVKSAKPGLIGTIYKIQEQYRCGTGY